ncbi:hypothetical protein FWK35_00037981, partial [Aphis craccivora]
MVVTKFLIPRMRLIVVLWFIPVIACYVVCGCKLVSGIT